MHHSVSAFASL